MNDHRAGNPNNSVLHPVTPFWDNGEIDQDAQSEDSDLQHQAEEKRQKSNKKVFWDVWDLGADKQAPHYKRSTSVGTFKGFDNTLSK